MNTTDLGMDITNPYYPENVLNFNLSRFEGLQKKRTIAMGFENLQIQDVEKLELRLFDRGLLTRRPLVSLGQFNGELITIPRSCEPDRSFEYHYDIVLDQNRFLEEDETKKCVNYPTEKFQDYQSCDDSFQKEILEKHSPYKPFWAFGKLGNEEPNHLFIPSAHTTINFLYAGAMKSNCPLPCTTTVAKTKFRFEKTSEGIGIEKLNWVVFYLPDEMRVTSTLFMDISEGQILSDMGGVLGLWLGFGVLQLFQSLAAFKYNVAKKTSTMIANQEC